MAKNKMTRRDFIKLGATAGSLLVAGPEVIGTALANRHPIRARPALPTSIATCTARTLTCSRTSGLANSAAARCR
jgi:hypothetical protein